MTRRWSALLLLASGWLSLGVARAPAAHAGPEVTHGTRSDTVWSSTGRRTHARRAKTLPDGKPKWTEIVGALTGATTAAAVIVGGVVGYRRFVRERPYYTRADLSVVADLFTHDGYDVLRVLARAKAIGQVRLELMSDDPLANFVAVQVFTVDMLDVFPPEWDKVLRAVDVFANAFIEAGETLEETLLLSLGQRSQDTLAYRVELGLKVKDPEAGGEYEWSATTMIPVALELAPPPTGGGAPSSTSPALGQR